jgi:hypothetical protein
MKRIDPIERIFEETPLPRVVEGAHREKLKHQLLAETQSASFGRRRMGRFTGGILIGKAAAVLAAVLLVGGGWAAAKIYEKFFSKVIVTLDQSHGDVTKLPNGAMVGTMRGVFAVANANDPKALETVKRHHEEMKQLIAQRKYELIRNLEYDGRKEYIYKFRFSDGSSDSMNFSMPLDKVTSWDDYQQKAAQEEKRSKERIGKALAAGRFRLIDMDVTMEHVCREVATNRKYKIHRISIPDPADRTRYSNIAVYFRCDSKTSTETSPKPQTSWQEYLDAVREGKWELISADTMPTYKYEVVLDDASKTIFRYGGEKPLKKPETMK